MKFFNKNKGQAIVEYGLIIVLSVVLALTIQSTQKSAETMLHDSAARNQNQNPHYLITPDKPNKEKLWEDKTIKHTEGYKFKPIAYFTVPNPIYIGEEVSYWDGSYDPDGTIIDRIWQGKKTVFNQEGEYKISLTVKDNDNLEDTYVTTVKVIPRNNYTKLIYDHANEQREVVRESSIYNVGSRSSLIIDHIYGLRKDRYNVEHTVIEKNLWKYVQNKAKDITYKVTIPVYEVTYNGSGQEVNRKYHSTVTQTDVKSVPQPADIQTELKNNTWTFFIYEDISSVKNPNKTWGVRNPSADYYRLDPEKSTDIKVRQDPDFLSSRTTNKRETYNVGYTSPTTPCKTCTEPNRFYPKNVGQTDYRTVTGCGGRSWSKPTHTRTYNWIDHETYDWIYKYTGIGTSQGNSTAGTLIKLKRDSWKTEGWTSPEMVGTGTSQTARSKYTNCEGNGWSESCWQPESNSASANDSWEAYDSDTWNENRDVEYNCRQVPNEDGNGSTRVCDTKTETRSCTETFYKRKEWSCSWYGTSTTSDTYSWGYKSPTSCSSWS